MGPPLHGAGRDRQRGLGATGNPVVRRLLPHGALRPALGHRQRVVVPEAEGAVEPSLRSASAIRAKRSRAWLGSTGTCTRPYRRGRRSSWSSPKMMRALRW
ncbi:hypothetical protein G6F63_016365 [Rhizopus arrhizus]|nr:hypothetical protein G6F63_016365 [Rhizopus arrhizus]